MNYIPKYLEKMKNIQQNILEYVDDEDDSEDKFQNIKDILTKNKIEDKRDELISFLYLLSKISDNYHHNANFYSKIDRILEYQKNNIQKFFSNSELFHIFKSSKRILLFLIEAKIMIIDESIAKRIIRDEYLKAKYPQYFQPEIQPFISKKWFPKYKDKKNEWVLEIEKEIPADFYELRKIGENNSFLCELIRKDSIDDFIVYMNKKNYQIDSYIYPSIYETNNFLLKNKKKSIIEYAAFFGSIQIFNYLRFSGVELTPSLWYNVIHSKNAEIIHLLEENQIRLRKRSYESLLKESIKCHHNDIAEYIQNNYLVNYKLANGIKYYNFKFIKKEQINKTAFNYLCRYDYYTLVSILLSTMNIDINNKIIYKIKIMNDIYIMKS